MRHHNLMAGFVATIVLSFTLPLSAQDTRFPVGAETMGQQHPSELMMKAASHMQAGKSEDATFYFYAGQLRWRTRLNADPDQDPSGEPALFSSLFEMIGPEVNGWAFGDIPQLQRTIDAVLAWDERYPDRSLNPDVHASIRRGLVDLREQIGREADEIREERAANGLENR